MTIQFRHTVAAGTALLLTAGLAGCATGAAASGTKTPPSGDASAKVTLDPLSEYLRVDMSDFDERSDKAEALIKKCMEDQGFEYPVRSIPSSDLAADEETLAGGMAPRTWVEKHGYMAIDGGFQSRGTQTQEKADPLFAYLEKLTPAQKAAWSTALYGKAADGNPDEFSPEESGCNGKGAKAAFPRNGTTVPPILEDAQKFLDSLQTHTTVTAIADEVAECMADQGYQPGFREAIYTRADEYKEANPSAVAEDPAVQKMKADEIKTALAEWDCQDKVDFFPRTFAALAELEKGYIAEHKKELEEVRIWLNQ